MTKSTNNHQFFVACKRAPVAYIDDQLGTPPSLVHGGTANVVAELAMALGADIIATAASDQDFAAMKRASDGYTIQGGDGRQFGLQFISHNSDVFDASQNYFFPEVMWPAMHNLWEQWHEPVFDDRILKAWHHFRAFNESYAIALLERSARTTKPAFFLQDYQLVVAPEFLREARPDSHIQVFIHCSWGSPDSWRVLPRAIRSGILESMCAADSIGVFSNRWARNFLLCVEEFVEGAVVDWVKRSVAYKGRCCAVNVVPLGYSPETISQLDVTLPPVVDDWVGDSPLVVTYGRTDPVKNTPRAIEAFRRAVLRNEGLRDAKLLVRIAPNHLHVDMNRRYASDIEEAAKATQASLGDSSIMVIEESSMSATLACYARADVLMFTPITDGQNLGPFEGVMVNQRDAGVVISEMAGCADVLGLTTTVVNPFDVNELALAIAQIVLKPIENRRLDFKHVWDTVARITLQSWVHGQLAVLPE